MLTSTIFELEDGGGDGECFGSSSAGDDIGDVEDEPALKTFAAKTVLGSKEFSDGK